MKRTSTITILLLLGVLVIPVLSADFPAKGKIVNFTSTQKAKLRASAGTDSASVGSLSRDTLVTVLALEGKWYKISLPREIGLYIPKQSVTMLSSDGSGKRIGQVTVGDTDLRCGLSAADAVLGKAQKGDRVVITGENKSWYIIEGYNRAAAYISSFHVETLAGSVVAKPAISPKPVVKPGSTKSRIDSHLQLQAQLDRAIKDQNFDRARKIIAELEALSKKAPEDERPSMEQVLSEYKTQLAEAARERELANQPRVEIKEYFGRIDDVGILLVPTPGDFRLMKGDEVVYYLKSIKRGLNLNDFLFSRVAIVGNVEKVPGWDRPLIKVTSIRVLDPQDETAGE